MDVKSNRASGDHCGEKQKNTVITAGPVVSSVRVMTPTITMRSYPSMYHRWSAAHFSELAKQIENCQNKETRFDIRHRAYVTGAIFATVSFIESAINELLKDAHDLMEESLSHSKYAKELPVTVQKAYTEYWKKVKKKPGTLKKYQKALSIAQKPTFDSNQQPFENVETLIRLRNALVHPRPETLGGKIRHDLEDTLKSRFQPNKLMTGAGNPFFPDKCLGHGCCQWAYDSCEAFADEFFQRMGLAPKYRAIEWEDP